MGLAILQGGPALFCVSAQHDLNGRIFEISGRVALTHGLHGTGDLAPGHLIALFRRETVHVGDGAGKKVREALFHPRTLP